MSYEPERLTESALCFLCLLAYPYPDDQWLRNSKRSPTKKTRPPRVMLFDALCAFMVRDTRNLGLDGERPGHYSALLKRMNTRTMEGRLRGGNAQMERRLLAAELFDVHGTMQLRNRRNDLVDPTVRFLVELGARRMHLRDEKDFKDRFLKIAKPVLHMTIALRSVLLEQSDDPTWWADGVKELISLSPGSHGERCRIVASDTQTPTGFAERHVLDWSLENLATRIPLWFPRALELSIHIAEIWASYQAAYPVFRTIDPELFTRLKPDTVQDQLGR